jgi:hypothetical protein
MMSKHLNEIPVVFYCSSLGSEPVRDWLRSLPIEDRRKIGLTSPPYKLVGRLVCRCAAHLVVGYGKFGVHCQAIESQGCCFVCMKGRFSSFTGLSRKRKKRHMMRLS